MRINRNEDALMHKPNYNQAGMSKSRRTFYECLIVLFIAGPIAYVLFIQGPGKAVDLPAPYVVLPAENFKTCPTGYIDPEFQADAVRCSYDASKVIQ
jgi:hypothetical protein